ncbi:MAG: ATP-binding protein [Methylococcaceae bacterium]
MRSNKAGQFPEAKFENPGLCGHNKRVLLDYRVPARLDEIEKLADTVNRALPDCNLAFFANLCLEELITNIVHHGLKNAADRFIQIQISLADEWLEILIKDDAPRFDPFMQAPKPNLELDSNQRPIGGLGIHMVKKLMDDVQAYYDGTGNLIVLHKNLPH